MCDATLQFGLIKGCQLILSEMKQNRHPWPKHLGTAGKSWVMAFIGW